MNNLTAVIQIGTGIAFILLGVLWIISSGVFK